MSTVAAKQAKQAAQQAGSAAKNTMTGNSSKEMAQNLINFQRYCQLSAIAFVANLPLGAWRINTEPYSPQWMIAIHASVPFLVYVRRRMGFGIGVMPISIASAISGQLMGGALCYQAIQIKNGNISFSSMNPIATTSKNELVSTKNNDLRANGMQDKREWKGWIYVMSFGLLGGNNTSYTDAANNTNTNINANVNTNTSTTFVENTNTSSSWLHTLTFGLFGKGNNGNGNVEVV